MNQLFIIGSDTWHALKVDEVEATMRDLKELDLFNLPYDSVDIQMLADDMLVSQTDKNFKLGDQFTITFRNVSLTGDEASATDTVIRTLGHDVVRFNMDGTIHKINTNLVGEFKERISETQIKDAIYTVAAALIILLATRNVVKSVHENKLAALGIGRKKNPYRFVTTISLPRDLDDASGESKPTGEHKRPHLRRGHIRRQHYGPAMAFIKKVWIAPVFVNVDRDWVDTRVAYNVSTRIKEPT